MNNMNKQLQKQAEQFVKEICINLWGMSSKEVKNYCIMIINQNMVMAKLNKDYLETANVYKKILNLVQNDKLI